NLRLFQLSMIGCVSLLGLLVLPVVVGGWVDELGFSERDAGLLSSASFLGSALAALVLAFRIHRLNLRLVAGIGLLGMAIADGVSALAGNLPPLAIVAVRFVSGVASAGVYGAVMGSLAGFRSPDRGYGLFMALQFLVSGAGLYLLPPLMPQLGVTGVFVLFAAAALVGLAFLSGVPGPASRAAAPAPATVEWKIILAPAAMLCLLGYGLFESSQMGQFAYIERIGVSLGLTPEQLGLSMGFASFIGIPGAMAVTVLGSRFGYFRPIIVAASIQIVVMVWLLSATGFGEYFIIACIFSIFWAFVLPYFQAMCARIDPRGSVVVAGGFATGSAGFLGPAGAALLVRPDDYRLMILGVIVTLAMVIVITALLARQLPLDNDRPL
ncbi:MAG: MFS transporter, partial [Pseudomonadota bacterium]